MHPLSRFLVFLALLVGSTLEHCAAAEPAKAPALPATFDLQAIDAYVAGQVKEKGFVGLSLAIMKDGKIVLAKGYGKSSRATGVEVGPDTLFAAGSVTKQFTCACILLLAEDGKLSVHDKVAKYYPDLTRANDITLYDLMTHVSGYPDYYPLDFVDRRMGKAIALDRLIQEYAGGKLDFEPRTRWSYSNTGYIILGRVVEKVSGKSFAQFLEERVFKHLGLEHSAFEPKEEKGVASGYTSFALGEPEAAPREAQGWIHAAGGLFTTPSDLCRWDLALLEGKLLKEESFQLMSTPRKLADGRTRNYGCGLGIAQQEGEAILRHTGAVSGYLAFNTMLPRTRSAVVLMTNCDHLDAGSLFNELATLLLKSQAGEVAQVPKVRGPAPKEAALEFLHQMQAGEIKRDNLGEEFNHYLSARRVQEARERLQALGEPEKVEVENVSERGGMEFAVLRFTFKSGKVKAYLYRTPDGKIQQFLLYKS
jgi:CubicO group peptidase (beta-lactamase class C family)